MFCVLHSFRRGWISLSHCAGLHTHSNLVTPSILPAFLRSSYVNQFSTGTGYSLLQTRRVFARLSPIMANKVVALPVRYHSVEKSKDNSIADDEETVKITYIDRDGERHTIKGKVGNNAMYLAQRHDLDVEGACEASLACCTCHVYVKEEFYDMLGEPTEEEEDMLDLAPFLQENSRLSCQIILSKEIDGIEVTLPSATRNFYVDGHKPKHH